jgi:DNA-binding PadR family transcriptional regulator
MSRVPPYRRKSRLLQITLAQFTLQITVREVTVLPKLEEMILLAVLKHGPDATAGVVQAALSDVTGHEQAFGSVFTTLDRLADKKFVRWKRGEPEERRGGRAPRLYTITGSGRAALVASLRATQELASGLEGMPVPAGAKA